MSLSVSWRGALAGALLLPALALANPRPLPFTYQHEQLPPGSTEVEQFVDLTPVRARSDSTGELLWYAHPEFLTEIEVGLTDRLELGLYFSFVPGAAAGFTQVPRGLNGTGLKQRLRYRFAPTGEWPVDVGVYGELSENEREIELEAKLLLQRRFGKLRVMANLSVEQEFYFDGTKDFVLAPSAGLTYEVTPSFQPGLEWWMRGEYPLSNAPSPRPFGLGPAHYVGPAALFQFGKLWWSTGVYMRVNALDHVMQPGEVFGALWVRTVVGIGL
jgi:hypothetical protein